MWEVGYRGRSPLYTDLSFRDLGGPPYLSQGGYFWLSFFY